MALEKYIQHRLYVTMPNGVKRWVHVRHDMKARWNMNKNGRQKSCAGWVERSGDEWTFNFRDAEDHLQYMVYYEKLRESYADRSTMAIAERSREASRRHYRNKKRSVNV